MWETLAIYAGGAAAIVLAWYCWFSRRNRRRGMQVLEWLERALSGQGHVIGIRWLTASRFVVPLRLAPNLFRHVSVLVRLTPREMPLQWLLSRYRKEQDTLTFHADFDPAPLFDLDVRQHRWCGRTARHFSANPERWEFEQPGPVVLTSRSRWQREVTATMNALLCCRDKDFLQLRFSRRSPHLSAIIPLENIAPGSDSANVFDVLRELAADSSASRL